MTACMALVAAKVNLTSPFRAVIVKLEQLARDIYVHCHVNRIPLKQESRRAKPWAFVMSRYNYRERAESADGDTYDMREFATAFYKSKAWQDCRAAYFRYRHGLCERCLSRGIYRPGEIVHHRQHLTPENIGNPAVTLCFDNLMLVCRDCHALEHKPEKRYKVDELGRIQILE